MSWILTKYLLSAGIVVFVSEVAKRSEKLGGFIIALPIVAILTLIWLHLDNTPEEKIGNYALYTFWYVIPTLPMFLAFPWLLSKLGFWLTLTACVLITALCFGLFSLILKPFGIHIF